VVRECSVSARRSERLCCMAGKNDFGRCLGHWLVHSCFFAVPLLYCITWLLLWLPTIKSSVFQAASKGTSSWRPSRFQIRSWVVLLCFFFVASDHTHSQSVFLSAEFNLNSIWTLRKQEKQTNYSALHHHDWFTRAVCMMRRNLNLAQLDRNGT
jgi:hypothetical protein